MSDQSRTPLPSTASDDLSTRLAALSAKATSGPWSHYDEVFRAQFGKRRVTEIQREKDGKEIIKWTGFDGLPAVTEKARNHNARFIVALVNAYRSGALVPAPTEAARGLDVTEEMVEAAAEIMWTDRDERIGGPWRGVDPNSIARIQTMGTARAALKAALSRTSPPETVGGGDALRRAAQAMADDYQTSADHHPEHVLVNLSDFNALCAALSSAPPAEETWQSTTGRLYEEPCLGWSPYTGTVVVRGIGGWTTITHSRPLPPAPAGEAK